MREPRNIGYARVSTKEQNLERQIQALVSAGVDETDIYKDKASGKDFKRDKWQELTREKLIEGDTLFILSLDRMGRDWKEISKEWEYVTQTKKANIVILDMPLKSNVKKSKNAKNKA
jgi:DNA invertase Pin-like site-specific DNA recombinase